MGWGGGDPCWWRLVVGWPIRRGDGRGYGREFCWVRPYGMGVWEVK